MKSIYHAGYQIALPDGHPFPISKYGLLKELLLTDGVIAPADLIEPDPIDLQSAALVHTRGYLEKLESQSLSAVELRRLGLPWSHQLWLRSRLAAGGTLRTARAALEFGLAGNLAGGTHHAFADHGEGFCVLNDVAIAICQLRAERIIERAAIIDLDVHQGNGSAAIFGQIEEVFTFSMHGERNFPSVKMRSDLDVALRDGTGDCEYLDLLGRHLPSVLERSEPDIAFYVAGVDVAADDRYGRLSLTEEGIRLRDRAVIEAVRGRGIPLGIVLAGGYAATRARTAELHAHAFREATAFERRSHRPEVGANRGSPDPNLAVIP
jgi:acetoin utilization deacetylase AcuC-like enzyme